MKKTRSGGNSGTRVMRGPRPHPSPGPAATAKPSFRGLAILIGLGLIVLTLAVYAPVKHFDFVNWDDPIYITDNPQVANGLTWGGVKWALTAGYAANWHPTTWLSHMLDVQWYGMNAGLHHVTNVIFHIANSLLLFVLLLRVAPSGFGALGRSALVAALFAVHPLHVESVAWVSERKDVLSTFFCIVTLWGYVEYARRPGVIRYLFVLVSFALGLMAKPMLVTVPFLLLLLDLWPLRRWDGQAVCGHSLAALVREKLPLFILAGASSVVTLLVQRHAGAVMSLDAVPLHFRLPNAVVAYAAYVVKTFWPVRLAAFYTYPRSVNAWAVAASLLFLMAVTAGVVRIGRRKPYLAVGWLWYIATLLPVVGLIQVGNQPMADRYTYLPLIGLFIAVVWGAADLLAGLRRPVLASVAGLVLLPLTIAAANQVRYWKDSGSLWGHAVEVTSEPYRAHNNLASFLAERGNYREAMEHYNQALRIWPAFAEAHNGVGNLLLREGNTSEAISHYAEAIRLKPAYDQAHNGLGMALASEGRFGEAVVQYTEALRLNPAFAEAHNNLGSALDEQGRPDRAMREFVESLRLKPGASAYYNLGLILLRQGRGREAGQYFKAALQLDPANGMVRRALENLMSSSPASGSQ